MDSGEPNQCGSGPDTLDSQGLEDGSIIVGLDPNEVRFCWQALLEQTGVEAAEVSEVILGQVLAAGQGQNPARQVMNHILTSGFFHEFPRVPDYPSSAVFFTYDADEKDKTKK
jgi:hypothetical protein